LNETYHFKNDDSKMSIQAGALQTAPIASGRLGAFKTIGGGELMTVSVQQPPVTDAMKRIMQRNTEKKREKSEKRKRMVQHMEESRT